MKKVQLHFPLLLSIVIIIATTWYAFYVFYFGTSLRELAYLTLAIAVSISTSTFLIMEYIQDLDNIAFFKGFDRHRELTNLTSKSEDYDRVF